MWYACISGKQTPLGITDPSAEAQAVAERQRLVDELAAAVAARLAPPPQVPVPAAPPSPPRPAKTVTASVTEYLEKRKPKLSPGGYDAYRIALQTHLCAEFGPREVASLTAEDIETWADRPAWSSTYRHNTLGSVMVWLNWAGHPLALARPPKESRGAGAVLSDEQFAQVLAAYDDCQGGDFLALLTVLRETGARPQEAATLTVEAVDWANACSIRREHKSKRHGKTRTLYFSAAAVRLLEAQRAKYGTGLLFRTVRGNPYGKKAIALNMIRISERVGFRAIAYGAGRHSFATKALCKGVPDTVVAALLGHSSTQMVHTNYSHVAEQSRVLKDAIRKVSGE